jgi:hypothetical protein
LSVGSEPDIIVGQTAGGAYVTLLDAFRARKSRFSACRPRFRARTTRRFSSPAPPLTGSAKCLRAAFVSVDVDGGFNVEGAVRLAAPRVVHGLLGKFDQAALFAVHRLLPVRRVLRLLVALIR